MKKKGLILFIFTVLCILIYSDNVHAETIALPNPSYVAIFEQGESPRTGAATKYSAFGLNGYKEPFGYYTGSTIPIPTAYSWKFNNSKWCLGKNFNFVGKISTTNEGGRYFFDEMPISRIHVVTDGGDNTCSFTKVTSYAIEFSCTGVASNSYEFYMDLGGYLSPYNTSLMLLDTADLSCNLNSAEIVGAVNGAVLDSQNKIVDDAHKTKDDIINNQNANSQSVIDDAHKTKDDIINNQNALSQNEIANANQNQQQTNDRLDGINDSLTDSTVDNSTANGFFENFQDNNHGLSSIITVPLQFIQNLASNTCTPISLSVPFVENGEFELPCMSGIYRQHFSSAFTLYQTITTGFIAYWVAIRIFALVKGMKDPNDDRIEVVDL